MQAGLGGLSFDEGQFSVFGYAIKILSNPFCRFFTKKPEFGKYLALFYPRACPSLDISTGSSRLDFPFFFLFYFFHYLMDLLHIQIHYLWERNSSSDQNRGCDSICQAS